MLKLVDSHCHLQQLAPSDREEALDRARQRGVTGFLVPAIHLGEVDELLTLAEQHADLYVALGVHPHEAKRWRSTDAPKLREWIEHPRVVAVGECGLDFFYDHAPREVQMKALREQWEVAIDAGMPVIVHNRDSNEPMLSVFREPRFATLQGVFHSYCSGPAMAREVLGRGCYLGFSGMVTFNRADNVREILQIAPKERILVETDTPFLAPVPYRGRDNEPSYVVEIAARVAAEVALSEDELHRQTGDNFIRLFLDTP